MAAYGALVSLTHIVEQIHRHPFPPITLHQEQVQPIIDKVAFLQDFLENYPNDLAHAFEGRIADAAVTAQDAILSRIQAIHGGSTSQGETISSRDLYQVLQKVLEDLESISTEVVEMKETNVAAAAGSSSSSSPKGLGQNIVVGLGDAVEEIMDKLTGELPSNLLIIRIAGMGGIGKTTLANTIYATPLIDQHFDVRAWVTISVEYNVQEVFLQLLLCLNRSESREVLSQLSEHQLGQKLFQSLWRRRYLIVLDDLWSFEAWEKISLFFRDDGNGSRIMITTRLSNVASKFNPHVHDMKFLDGEKSWDLFCKYVFRGEEEPSSSCPPELEETGKMIARKCGGLPLSIIVIGSLLAKSPKSIGSWDFIEKNLSSAVNLIDDEYCFHILHTSYSQLPVHLKPCFLYMSIYPQNSLIRVSRLIMAWVAEGFLRPIRGKSLEMVGEDYLRDLIERNLIIVRKFGYDGKIKYCQIMHDLLRDVCLREAEKEQFLRVAMRCSVGIHQSTTEEYYYPNAMSLDRLLVTSLVRHSHDQPAPPISNYVLTLWILRYISKYRVRESADVVEGIFGQVNLRYLAMFGSQVQSLSTFPSSLCLLWNLQTLVLERSGMIALAAPPEIWKMSQLRHVIFGVFDLPDPPSDAVLENLQTLCKVHDFKWSEEAVKRIPNLKKLKVFCDGQEYYCIDKIGCLNQVESLSCTFAMQGHLLQQLSFPHSLRKLTLEGMLLRGEDMTTAIGPLPHLQVLKLKFCAFTEPVWETVEDQFCSLKFLLMDTCGDLKWWITDSSHFPCLEQLVLRDMEKFDEIPSGIGDIPTLQYIELDRCTDSAVVSAKKILDDQQELDNEALRIRVKLWKKDQGLLSLATHNFRVHP
ncbi:hypothetical protein C2S51_027665 [Perilla frutescens var. frutescens]|nr:hypothetical protein C2S51_027665 [Perilla frutescens var. frutescens]